MSGLARPRHAVLTRRLKALVRDAQTEQLLAFFATLTNSEFRAVGTILADDALVADCTDAAFWRLLANVVSVNPKAFLGTFLKAAVKRYAAGTLTVTGDNEPLCRFARQASPVDCRKVFEALLPVLAESREVVCLLDLFGPADAPTRTAILLKHDTRAVCHALFTELRKADDDASLIRDVALRLMHRGTQRSFRMAAIVQAYFALAPLPGQLSLQLKPYELSQLETSEAAFLKILR